MRPLTKSDTLRNPYLIASVSVALGMGVCRSINENLAASVSDPFRNGPAACRGTRRPGTAEYDEFMKERERKRLEPAAARDNGTGGAPGLRQPVHAEDLAIGAIAAAHSSAAVNKFYSLPGAETLAYREMIGRIFDALGMPRRTVWVPPLLWRAGFGLAQPLFPGANVAMGIRMMKDMTFDSSPAVRDFGWNPHAFKPAFD